MESADEMNWQEKAEAAADAVRAIEREIADLEARKQRFESDAAGAREAASAALQTIGHAMLAGDDGLKTTSQKARTDKERAAAESSAAAASAETRIASLNARLADARRTADAARELAKCSSELEALEALKPAASTLIAMVAGFPHVLRGLIADAVSRQIKQGTSIEGLLDEHCALRRATLERANSPLREREWSQLPADTAFFASRPFSYLGADFKPGTGTRTIPQGWIGVIPAAFAKRAVAAGAGKVLPPPERLEITIRPQGAHLHVTDASGVVTTLSFNGGAKAVLEPARVLQLVANGMTVGPVAPSPSDLVAYANANHAHGRVGPTIALGLVTADEPDEPEEVEASAPAPRMVADVPPKSGRRMSNITRLRAAAAGEL